MDILRLEGIEYTIDHLIDDLNAIHHKTCDDIFSFKTFLSWEILKKEILKSWGGSFGFINEIKLLKRTITKKQENHFVVKIGIK